MDNINIAKGLLFSQYYGQNIYLGDTMINSELFEAMEAAISVKHIELKPLSCISNDDAVMVEFMGANNFKRCLESYGDEFENLILKHHQIDYLRSKGYALPYMGISVEKQIEYGWIKLVE